MSNRIIYDYHAAEPVEAGGFTVVRRTCTDTNRPGALASFNGITRLISIHPDKDEAEAAAAEANQRLGDGLVPNPFSDDDTDEEE